MLGDIIAAALVLSIVGCGALARVFHRRRPRLSRRLLIISCAAGIPAAIGSTIGLHELLPYVV